MCLAGSYSLMKSYLMLTSHMTRHDLLAHTERLARGAKYDSRTPLSASSRRFQVYALEYNHLISRVISGEYHLVRASRAHFQEKGNKHTLRGIVLLYSA